jgi:electron transfer flavoprotein beta subunit
VKIVVLIAGVHDPKWPIVLTDGGLPAQQVDRMIMSPFDEAALEIALKIRDAHRFTSIRAFVMGKDSGAKLARTIAAFNIAEVSTVQIEDTWNQRAVASGLTQVCADSDLVLLGREFGDYDDGLVPPLLAGMLGAEFFGRAQIVEAKDRVRLMREAGSFEEWCAVATQLVVSVTNDRRNRLRKPLMKNVMLARQANIGCVKAGAHPSPGLELHKISELITSRTTLACSMIEGTAEQQAQALALLLVKALS